MAVMICGLPKSGNRLIKEFLHSNEVQAIIQHMPDIGSSEEIEKAIVPHRRPDVWWKSVHEEGFGFMGWGGIKCYPGGWEQWHFDREIRIASEWGPKEILRVQYEFLVSDPIAVGQLIADFVGFEFQSWHTPIKNGNQKWLRVEG